MALEAYIFQSVCWIWCCSEESAPSSHTFTDFTEDFTCLMMGLYLGSRNRDMIRMLKVGEGNDAVVFCNVGVNMIRCIVSSL